MTSHQTVVHIISHSHWDREWYLPFEQFRLRLVRLLDQVLDLLEDPRAEFRSFHLDGYVLAIDDYLQIRPEQAERIRRHVAAKRLAIGPWYVLHDAFLTSGEAQLRNLHYGIERASQLGGATMIGYFPDTFGNHSQSAQILQEFGITEAVFGRGIAPVAENNTVRHSDRDDTSASELWWQAPNGDRVFSIFLANWYHNGMELPVDAAAGRTRIAAALANVERFATTPHLLLMNGCDHQPVQTDVGTAIARLNETMPALRFTHSSFSNYLAAVREYEQDWPTAHGELTSARTDGWTTLVNTASARLYLKQANAELQRELERWVEPWAALAWLYGKEHPEAQIRYAWKLLLENHTHDGICGCSVDAVHDEMMTRFDRVRQVADVLSGEALAALVAQVDTADVANKGVPLVVFNPLGWARAGWVQATVDLDDEVALADYALFDAAGTRLAVSVEDQGWIDGFTLPPDRFRVVWRRRRYQLQFRADHVPALGYATFVW
ncbi:MAG: alpha-mannosidase, partial [Roseiflexaceae bacterium]|nr:alpha-mannosidase [Roseiflexaceae bacterium]